MARSGKARAAGAAGALARGGADVTGAGAAGRALGAWARSSTTTCTCAGAPEAGVAQPLCSAHSTPACANTTAAVTLTGRAKVRQGGRGKGMEAGSKQEARKLPAGAQGKPSSIANCSWQCSIINENHAQLAAVASPAVRHK
ncbi:predicted amino acid aldolase or racemase [Serpentinimonas maccroryi]|uniref:Predicted amino acid aldolase or racemase n=1 Tax=Serpentinimonas maccroryi TaxID=1458426 RepID=A0A060NLL3_9BURK|nr:predicted amino acid aldolase or racemase [Serpentinimonas maccroryi]